MILPGFIILLMLGGILAWIAARKSLSLARWISLVAVGADFFGRNYHVDPTGYRPC